jgi:hypothetical protein
MLVAWQRRAVVAGTKCQSATCLSELEVRRAIWTNDDAFIMVTVATLVGGFACIAVSFEAPFVAFVAGGLAYWMLTQAVH